MMKNFPDALEMILPVTTAVSLMIAILVIKTVRWHAAHTADHADGIQKVHNGLIPRIGGVGIFLGYTVAAIIFNFFETRRDSDVWYLLLAACPALLFGLMEDITRRVGTKERLLATMVSGLLAWYLTGYALHRVDLPGVDLLLAYTPVAVLFTAFAVGGVANAINMIDGFNGLASGTVLVCLTAMGIMALHVSDMEITLLIAIIAAATMGFFLVNFPFGRIFLGDGGAYALGFMLAWIAVMLAARHPEQISPWAPLLACAYPVLETLFSMGRRVMRGLSMDKPDRTHLHSLIYRRVIPRYLRTTNPALRNAAVSPFLWVFAAVPATLSTLFMSSTLACITAFVGTALLYAVLYARLSHFRWRRPKLHFRRPPSAD